MGDSGHAMPARRIERFANISSRDNHREGRDGESMLENGFLLCAFLL